MSKGRVVARIFIKLNKGILKRYDGYEKLDLKVAARSTGEKSIEMIKVTDINKVTGYIRNRCSPIGMKKLYTTVLHSSCHSLDTIVVSAGKIRYQIELAPKDLISLTQGKIDSIIMKI